MHGVRLMSSTSVPFKPQVDEIILKMFVTEDDKSEPFTVAREIPTPVGEGNNARIVETISATWNANGLIQREVAKYLHNAKPEHLGGLLAGYVTREELDTNFVPMSRFEDGQARFEDGQARIEQLEEKVSLLTHTITESADLLMENFNIAYQRYELDRRGKVPAGEPVELKWKGWRHSQDENKTHLRRNAYAHVVSASRLLLLFESGWGSAAEKRIFAARFDIIFGISAQIAKDIPGKLNVG